jgi:hypothetical protein
VVQAGVRVRSGVRHRNVELGNLAALRGALARGVLGVVAQLGVVLAVLIRGHEEREVGHEKELYFEGVHLAAGHTAHLPQEENIIFNTIIFTIILTIITIILTTTTTIIIIIIIIIKIIIVIRPWRSRRC